MTIDTIRFAIKNRRFYDAVLKWRTEDLCGNVPARINADALRSLVDNGKVINLQDYREKQLRELLDDLNEYGLGIIVKDKFQMFRQGSWERDITCVIDEFNHQVFFELSLPKFFHGQNVDLLFDWKTKIFDFIVYLYHSFKLPVPSVEEMRSFPLYRVDPCYYLLFDKHALAKDVVYSFRGWVLHKRKRVHFYDSSMMLVGRSYSLKFYLKLPEFQKHDKRIILKTIGSLIDVSDVEARSSACDYHRLIDHCERLADGMLRIEFTIRKQKLEYDGIFTIGDLIDLDIVTYYESLLDRMGVLKMGRTEKDEYFAKLKHDKKLIQYCALLDTFGVERIKEIYDSSVIRKYNKKLREMNIFMQNFNLVKEIDLSVRKEDRIKLLQAEEQFKKTVNFLDGRLF